MTWAAALAAVVVVSIVTYASRAGLILFLADRGLPAEATRALRYVGPAVLSALTVNLVAGAEGMGGVTAPEIVGVGVAAAVGWFTKNLVASLAAGMLALWVVILLF